MAEIDKNLPNTDLPSVVAPDMDVEVTDETKLVESDNVEATELPDGGMEINFDPNSGIKVPGTE